MSLVFDISNMFIAILRCFYGEVERVPSAKLDGCR